MSRYDERELRDLIPLPAHDANKYSRGRLVLYGGSETYPGAIALAARAAQRAGSGYTEVFTEDAIVPIVQSLQASLVVRPWKHEYEVQPIASRPEKPCAYLIGPGIDLDGPRVSTAAFFVMGKAKAPMIIDGGALELIAAEAGHVLCRKRFIAEYETVLTPHMGEAKRLAGAHDLPTDDPAQLAYLLSLAYGAIIVLKGPITYISDGEEVFAIGSGTPALAKAGTGDVLSGIIGAFLAQGMNGLDASVLGVTVHAKAGCMAAEVLTTVSVIPEDVIDCIAPALLQLSEIGTH